MNPESNPVTVAFLKWHERLLFRSFAWLTTCLLGGVAIAAIFEFVGLSTPGVTPFITLAVVYVAGLMSYTAWRQFWGLLQHAQYCANQATCGSCGAYGLFDVVIDADHIPAECRRCGHRWKIE